MCYTDGVRSSGGDIMTIVWSRDEYGNYVRNEGGFTVYKFSNHCWSAFGPVGSGFSGQYQATRKAAVAEVEAFIAQKEIAA
jgi:hypothetical protein